MAGMVDHIVELRWPRLFQRAILLFCLMPGACRQQMAEQPRYDPLEASSFFSDGRSARPLVPGTVARGQLRDDPHLFTGRVAGGTGSSRVSSPSTSASQSTTGTAALAEYVETLPFPATDQIMERGQGRYNIYCVVCHGPLGKGDGKIVERGYTRPPSFHNDISRGLERRGIQLPLRDAPVGYLFDVITSGFGAMPDYAEQVPVEDRWAIIAYIRALQASQPLAANPQPSPKETKP
jgi:mono/diheme cytochrome c family protein